MTKKLTPELMADIIAHLAWRLSVKCDSPSLSSDEWIKHFADLAGENPIELERLRQMVEGSGNE